MILASHYVIKEIRRMLEVYNGAGVKERCEKFSRRYAYDKELKNICDKLEHAVESRDEKWIERLVNELKKLENIRKIETSGASELWLRERRPKGVSVGR